MAEELMRRFDEASIDASLSRHDPMPLVDIAGAPYVSVWIASPDELERASEILREVRTQRTYTRCPSCDYNLRGHTGEATCPECGHHLVAPTPDVYCPQCGESAPATFEVCWNCGASMRSSDKRDV